MEHKPQPCSCPCAPPAPPRRREPRPVLTVHIVLLNGIILATYSTKEGAYDYRLFVLATTGQSCTIVESPVFEPKE